MNLVNFKSRNNNQSSDSEQNLNEYFNVKMNKAYTERKTSKKTFINFVKPETPPIDAELKKLMKYSESLEKRKIISIF